jgi:hypothetical protein
MTPKCFQTLDNGQRCSAPAMHGSRYCRHHDAERLARQPKPDAPAPLILPPLLNKPSLLIAVNQVAQALAEDRIKRSVAHSLLSAIKLAARLLTEMAEAGLTLHCDEFAEDTILHNLETARTNNHHSHDRHSDDRLAIALAASGDHRKAGPFSASRSSAYPPEDPATARLVKELMAQTHELARTQNQAAKI